MTPLLWPRLRLYVAMTAIAAAAMLSAGCNDKQKIGNAAATTMREGHSVVANAQAIQSQATSAVPDLDDISARAVSIEASGNVIINASSDITDALPGVQNVPGFFGRLAGWLKWLIVIVAVFAVCILLNQLGIMPVIRKLMAWVPTLIPSPVKREAAADVAMLDDDDPMTPREVVANKRADPVYNAAFEAQKRQHDLRKAQRTAVIVKGTT